MKNNLKLEWFRVSKQNPCVICSKEDWCTYSHGIVCCMRVMSHKPMKNGGYMHKITDDIPRPIQIVKKQEVKIDCEELIKSWYKLTTPKSMIIFAEKLGVDPMALHLLGCTWAYPENAWAFPMKDEFGKTVGIRLRNEIGQKWAVRGSKSGIFIPNMEPTSKTLYIVEGPTDCAACLSLGFFAIGRPSCLGNDEAIRNFIGLNKIKEVVIIADNDEPGIAGANKLQNEIKVSSCILILPCKDIREFLNNGGTKEVIESMIKNLIWTKK